MSDNKVMSLEEVLAAIGKGEKGPFVAPSSAETMEQVMMTVTGESVTMTPNKAEGTLTIVIGKVATESLATEPAKPQGCFRVKD